MKSHVKQGSTSSPSPFLSRSLLDPVRDNPCVNRSQIVFVIRVSLVLTTQMDFTGNGAISNVGASGKAKGTLRFTHFYLGLLYEMTTQTRAHAKEGDSARAALWL